MKVEKNVFAGSVTMSPVCPRPAVTARRLAAVAVSVVVGAATHVVWDSFTHASGVGVFVFPVLRTPVFLFERYAPKAYTLLQHFSSLVGLGLLAFWGLRWYRRTPPKSDAVAPPLPASRRALAAGAVPLPTAATMLIVLHWRLADAGVRDIRLLRQSIGQAIFSAGSVFTVHADGGCSRLGCRQANAGVSGR